PKEATIVTEFEKQVQQTPENVAVVFGDTHLTYAELNRQANRLAYYLLDKYKIKADTLIALKLERSERMIIAILAVLKSGGAYVPIDPEYPSERVKYIIDDSGSQALIDEDVFQSYTREYNNYPEVNPTGISFPENLAYVIYTSGSTGQPKGVMVTQRALINSIVGQQHFFKLNLGDKSSQFFSYSFDVSIFETFLTLINGGALFIISNEIRQNPYKLELFLKSNDINVLTLPASYLKFVDVKNISSLKKIITGGEKINKKDVERVVEEIDYYNAYGPTEATICSTIFEVKKDKNLFYNQVPIGIPIPNSKIYILDKNKNLVPQGAIGEIFIGGHGLAKGYINNKRLTSRQFLENPFCPEEKIYRTGDLGRWLEDGNIEFIGRIDNQIKYNGYRIELEEIESVLGLHIDISAVSVLLLENENDRKDLIAVYTGKYLNILDLKQHINAHMPEYMCPNHFLHLNEFPLTHNGKTDKRKLKSIVQSKISIIEEYVPPTNSKEYTLQAIYKEIFDKDRISVLDNFFELGGNSLKAMALSRKIRLEFQVDIPINVIFEKKNIKSLADYIDFDSYSKDEGNFVSDSSMIFDLSYNQKIYFSNLRPQLDIVTSFFTVEIVNISVLKTVVKKILKKHEILRTNFILLDDKVVHKIIHEEKFNVEINTPILIDNTFDGIRSFLNEIKFDLYGKSLLSVNVFQMNDGKNLIALSLHHIIVDGHSLGVLEKEIKDGYRNEMEQNSVEFPESLLQYKDFVKWQNNYLNSEEGIRCKEFWKGKLTNFKQIFKSNCHSISQRSSLGNLEHRIEFGAHMTERLKRQVMLIGSTLPIYFLSILFKTLYHILKDDEISIVSTVSERYSSCYQSLDFSKLIGFFANQIIIKPQLKYDDDFIKFLNDVQRCFLESVSNGSYPLLKLIKDLTNIDEDDFIDSGVVFNYHNYDHLQNRNYFSDNNNTTIVNNPNIRSALVLTVEEFQNGLIIKLIFNSKVFDEETILNLKSYLLNTSQNCIDELEEFEMIK
ncbi:MAG: amino acid adenylation domain-containing protein, partial [Sphingobacterium sp.]|uniref:amino acid adenylation domain-containing protein n=1 Tax=Sphingobacterium sp. TaxID=341027 RepID=UPI00284B0118